MQIDLSPAQERATVLSCLQDHYGLSGVIQRIGGENINYQVTTPDGQRFVLKIVDDDMPPEVVDMEFHAIEHAKSAGIDFNFPEIIKNNQGKTETGIKLHSNALYRSRLLKFIDGTVLENSSDISEKLLKNVGNSLARFTLAMESFDHPAAHRSHRWDLAAAGQHRDKIQLIEDAEKRELLTWAFDAWERAAEKFEELPRQFIHADANRENIMVEGERVVGLIDFGDACINPTVCELAICLAYIMLDEKNPLEKAIIVIEGYSELRPLAAIERSVLFPLACGRLAVTIGVAAKRRLQDPDRPGWFGSDDLAWALLPVLRAAFPQM